MKFKEPDYPLLARYLAGKCTDQERKLIEQWVRKHSANEERLKDFKQIWELTNTNKEDRTVKENVNLEKKWGQLKERLKQDDVGQPEGKKSPSSKRRVTSIHSTFHTIIRVAAIFLVAGLFGVLSYSYWSQPEPKSPEPILREVSTADAQRANLTLGDGTKVLLNADTKMEFPKKFASDIREVYLKGEAYFKVVSNPDKPFVIHSGGTVTRVLGTSFAIRSYPDEKEVQVVVEEGRVSFKSTAEQSSPAPILTANELGRYLTDAHEIKTKQVEDMDLYLGWKEGHLKFKEAPMSRVAREIERRYGVQVNFEQEDIAAMSLTAFLKSRSIRNVLDVIATSLNVNYRLKENNVVFYRK